MDDHLTKKRQEDLKLSQEIKNHEIKIKNSISDITEICKEVVDENQSVANFLKISLRLGEPLSYNKQVTSATFTAIVDKKLLKVSLQKLLEIGMFLSNNNGRVSITPLRTDNIIEVVINFDYYISDTAQQDQLFIEGFGSLKSINNLEFGSGLEGFIAKGISGQLNIPIKVIPKPEEKQTSFVLYISIYSDR